MLGMMTERDIRQSIKHHRRRVLAFANILRFFAQHPGIASLPTIEGPRITKSEARVSCTIHRRAHSERCRQLGALDRSATGGALYVSDTLWLDGASPIQAPTLAPAPTLAAE